MKKQTSRQLTPYTDSMSKSIWDKAFFMDKIEGATAVIDFGCADGAMIRFLGNLFPQMSFYGYDIDQGMINLARRKNDRPNVFFYGPDEKNKLIFDIRLARHECVCLSLSSVLHEVYSFPESGGIQRISDFIWHCNVKYVAIRDMYYHCDYCCITCAPATIRERVGSYYVQSFERKYGKIDTWKNLTHFLMKYQWVNNGWEEELAENYYSWNLGKFVADVSLPTRPLVFEAHYMLPHLCYRWFAEYGFFAPYIHTHAQFILTV